MINSRAARVCGLLSLLVSIGGCGGVQEAAEREDPEVVVLTGDLGNSHVAAGATSSVVSRLRIDTRAVANAARPSINLALVVDTSGSMDGEAMRHARQASLSLLDTLRPTDRLAVIAFHSRTEVLLASTPLEGADLPALREQIGRMEARGTTDLAGGLQAGLEELVRNFQVGGVNRLVLLSDGVPNDSSTVLPLAVAAGERGIRITALGLGNDYDETLMAQVAQSSGGRFHYVSEASAVAGVFRDEVLRFERLLARNLTLQLRAGPGVRIDEVLGQPNTVAAGVVQIPLGDISEGEHRDVIVRLTADARRPGTTLELIDAVLTFDDAVQEAGRLERSVFLGARSTADAQELEAGRNQEVEDAAARMVAAVTTVQAIQVARAGNIDEARAILDRAAREAELAAYASSSEQASGMRALRAALPSVAEGAPASAPADYAPDSEDAPAPAAPPETVIRSVHSEAMDVIQSAH